MDVLETLEIKSGEKTSGYINVGTDTDGSPINIPVLTAKGRAEGPTVWVIGCIHGDEYGGAASVIQYFKELNVDELKGTLIGVPVANPPSFKNWSRISPLDGVNLNRVFPGDPKGTFSQRLAHRLFNIVKESADYVIDLHSGGLALHVPYFVIVDDGESEAAQKSLWIAERMGTQIIWISNSEKTVSGTSTNNFVINGIPSVTVEVGGGTITKEDERLFKLSISNALKALEMIPGEAPIQEAYQKYHDAAFLFSKKGGLFVPEHKVGDVMNKGDLIGTIIDLHGNVLEELRSPFDNGFLAATGNLYWPTEPGRLIAEVYTD